MIEFIQNHYAVFVAIHVLAVAIGIGGATVSDILFFKFLKDYRISKKETEVLHVLKDIILTTIFFIVLTGIFLFLAKPHLLLSGPFLVKAIASMVLIINGICLHVFIAPYLIHINLKRNQKMSRSWQRLAFALGAISICSWYSVFFIASLKYVLPQNFLTLLCLYLFALFTAITVSQIFDYHLQKKVQSTNT